MSLWRFRGQMDHINLFLFLPPQPCGEQLGSAASRPAASSLPAALHPLRSGQGARGRCVLGVCPPPQQAARPGSARLPGRPAVCHTEKLNTRFKHHFPVLFANQWLPLFCFFSQEVLACFHPRLHACTGREAAGVVFLMFYISVSLTVTYLLSQYQTNIFSLYFYLIQSFLLKYFLVNCSV